MKAVSFLVFIFATSVTAAPTIFASIPEYLQDTNRQNVFRDKRSKYGQGYYTYGTVSSPLSSYTPYQWSLPTQGYLNPLNYGYQAFYPGCGRGLFRADETNEDREIMSFSDKEQDHTAAARTDNEGSSTSNTQLTPLSAPGLPSIGQLMTSPAQAYGMFPGVNTGCNVPLYFSCSPSIIPGRLVKTPGFGYGPFGYRGVDDMSYEPHTGFHEGHVDHNNVPGAVDAGQLPGVGMHQ